MFHKGGGTQTTPKSAYMLNAVASGLRSSPDIVVRRVAASPWLLLMPLLWAPVASSADGLFGAMTSPIASSTPPCGAMLCCGIDAGRHN